MSSTAGDSPAVLRMRLIVIDTSWLLPALLSRGTRPRSRGLLILTALGGLTLRRHSGEEELRTLRDEGERLGATVYDDPLVRRLEAIDRRREENARSAGHAHTGRPVPRGVEASLRRGREKSPRDRRSLRSCVA